MHISQQDLLPGETLLLSKGANAIIKINEYGLSRFAFDQLMPIIGMKGKEAIGGKLHITNYRLVFKSHSINRLRGKFSIFLPNIQAIKDASGIITKKIEVLTAMQQFEFVAWGIPALILAIKLSKDKLVSEAEDFLKRIAVSHYEKCGQGLQVFKTLEAINVGILTVEKLRKVVGVAQNPVEAASILNLLELFDDQQSNT